MNKSLVVGQLNQLKKEKKRENTEIRQQNEKKCRGAGMSALPRSRQIL